MNDIIELEITPLNAEIVVTMPPVESVDMDVLPLLTPVAAALPTDPLAYYILASE